jgi:hypothetical protein
VIVAYPDDVSVVELVLERHDFPHEAEGAELEEGVPRLDQHQYSSAIQIIILFHQYSYAIQINIFFNVIQLDNSWSASDPDPAPGFAIALEEITLHLPVCKVSIVFIFLSM